MKYSFTLLFLISFFSNSQDPSVTEYYGQKIDFQEIDNYYSVKNDLLKVNKKHLKIKGKILSSCPMKGCWMKVNVFHHKLLSLVKLMFVFVFVACLSLSQAFPQFPLLCPLPNLKKMPETTYKKFSE